MYGDYVVVSSITYAYKGMDALKKRGIYSKIVRPPRSLSECGCHYALKILNAPLEQALLVLRTARVNIIKSGGAAK